MTEIISNKVNQTVIVGRDFIHKILIPGKGFFYVESPELTPPSMFQVADEANVYFDKLNAYNFLPEKVRHSIELRYEVYLAQLADLKDAGSSIQTLEVPEEISPHLDVLRQQKVQTVFQLNTPGVR